MFSCLLSVDRGRSGEIADKEAFNEIKLLRSDVKCVSFNQEEPMAAWEGAILANRNMPTSGSQT